MQREIDYKMLKPLYFMSLCCVSEIIFLHLHPKAKNKHHLFLSKSKTTFHLQITI